MGLVDPPEGLRYSAAGFAKFLASTFLFPIKAARVVIDEIMTESNTQRRKHLSDYLLVSAQKGTKRAKKRYSSQPEGRGMEGYDACAAADAFPDFMRFLGADPVPFGLFLSKHAKPERRMGRQAAESLVDEIQRHSGIIPPDRDMCLDALLSARIPSRSRFYATLPYKVQWLDEGDRVHHFSLRRLLRNDGAMDYHNDWLKWMLEIAGAASEFFGAYSSNGMVRKIRKEPELLRMMSESTHPFSLLCRMDTYDHSGYDANVNETRPVLVIPGAKYPEKIAAWENANTRRWRCDS